jgi:hypothetical protein
VEVAKDEIVVAGMTSHYSVLKPEVIQSPAPVTVRLGISLRDVLDAIE